MDAQCRHQFDYWEEKCATCSGTERCMVPVARNVQFFLPMIPPTTTHQTKQVKVLGNRPIFYEPAELLDARAKLQAHLGRHAPEQPFTGAVRLLVKWLFPITGKHRDGEYKTTRPDTDNLQKLLKDVMTDLHFWVDDALVASEIIEKFWADKPGLYICIEEL